MPCWVSPAIVIFRCRKRDEFCRDGFWQSQIFLVRANGPVIPEQQAVLFYLDSDDVAAFRRNLLERGLLEAGSPPGEGPPMELPERNAVFDLRYPFSMPAGELRVHDLDGFCLLIGQLA